MTPGLTPTLNKRALLKLGYTPALIEALLGKPDEVKQRHKGFKRWVEHLYARDRVTAAMQDPQFTAHVERRKLRTAKAAQRKAAIPTKYADWRDALPEACEGMFSLNRYAKYRSCSPLHRQEIYHLKNELIELLYNSGCCVLSWIHRQAREALVCRECAGSGEMCDHCGGSGVWSDARTLEFWCFQFQVAGKTYCWHQPVDTITFLPAESLAPQDWQGLASQEKPLKLAQSRFAAVKELLRWILDRAQSAAEDASLASPPLVQPPAHPNPQDQDSIPF